MAGFIAVHSGAGNCLDETKYQKVIKDACFRSCQILRGGDAVALDACEAAIVTLENSGNTNAGFGANLTWDGKVECDASIMDGANLQFGACTNVATVKNPIHLARIICDRQSKMLALERIPPMMLAGQGAASYAKEVGCPIVDTDSLISRKSLRCYEFYKAKVARVENLTAVQLNPLDTVGAVCIDSKGNCAAGCSSGGLILKISGRVGQAATYGAGCWAQNSPDVCVATCTSGNGEYIMKTLLAKEIAEALLSTDCPATALHNVFKEKFLNSSFLPKNKELYAGALSLVFYPKLGTGEVLWCHTTKSICLGYMSTSQKVPKFVNSSLPTYSTPGESIAVSGQPFKLPIS